MDYNEYINEDGTYTSPKNGKVYKSKKALISHLNFKKSKTTGFAVVNNTKVKCQYCEKETTPPNIKKHEESCYMNPKNIRECVVCGTIIKNKESKGTCSHACSNTYYRHGKEGGTQYKTDEELISRNRYQDLCFRHHGKECIVCGEKKIVAAHHINHDHNDNRVENLVPLCPTHHQYIHSRYADEVQPYIDEFLEKLNSL
jgi:hypothetical protein